MSTPFDQTRWRDARDAFEVILADAPDDPRALDGLGRALARLEEADRSFEVRERAYRIFVAQNDRRAASAVALGIGLDIADYRGMAVANGWLQRAATLLADEAESPEHGWLALWQGHFARALEHDLDRARTYANDARRIARALKVADLELLAIALEGLINVTAGSVQDGMRQLDEATAAALAGEISAIDSVLNTCCLMIHACERVSDWERAAQWAVQIDTVSKRMQLGSFFTGCQAELSALLIGRGEWQRAETELSSAIRILEAQRPLVLPEAIVQMAELRRRQGRIDEAVELFNRCPTMTESIIGLAAIALERGDALRAAESLERLQRRPLAEKWVQRAVMLELLIRARTLLGDDDAARAHADELSRLSSTVGIRLVTAHATRAQAIVERDPSKKRQLLEDAIDLFDRCPAPWDAARTRLELAETLRALGRDAFAAEEERAAKEVFKRLGIAQRSDSPLTRREAEILRLVADGLSDKEVAVRLKLSEHTVHRHMSNILAKLELPSRAAAVAKAASAGWMAGSGQS